MKIHRGDMVLVIAGKEKGKSGRVERTLPQENRVMVEGINLVTRHIRPRPDVRQTGRIRQEAPIHISNVMLLCNKCSKPARVAATYLQDGRKVRVCLQCKETID